MVELRQCLGARRGGAEPALRPDGAVRALHGAALRRQHHALSDRPCLAPRPAAGARPARPGRPGPARARAGGSRRRGAPARRACVAWVPGPYSEPRPGPRTGGVHRRPYPTLTLGCGRGIAQVARGRMREFFQCDLDIAGAYPGMAADAEVVSVRARAPPPQAAALHSSIPPHCLWSLFSDGGSPCGMDSARVAAAHGPASSRDRSRR